MRQHTPPKDGHISRRHHHVPEEVTRRETLHQPCRARIPPDPTSPVGIPPLLVPPDDPQGDGVDEYRLDERDGMDVPIDLGATVEVGVSVGEETTG